jgi:predicted dehydrogenase
MPEALRVGILGTASIADRIVAGARKSSLVRISAVAGREPERTNAWAAKRGIPHAFESYGALLESGAVDAVYIPLPNSMHAEWTIRALDLGLPVLCEKPACTTARDAAAVSEAALRNGVPVMEAFMYIHHPLYREVFRLIGEGHIGRVRTIDSRFTWLCDEPECLAANAGLQGGALFDVGCYCVHLSRKVAGCEPIRIASFRQDGFKGAEFKKMGFSIANDVDDLLVGMMEFENGVIAHFETGLSLFERHGAEITGTAGVIQIERPWLQENVPTSITLITDDGRRPIRIDPADTYQAELEAFARTVGDCRRLGKLSEGAMSCLADMSANMSAILSLLKSGRRSGDR